MPAQSNGVFRRRRAHSIVEKLRKIGPPCRLDNEGTGCLAFRTVKKHNSLVAMVGRKPKRRDGTSPARLAS